MERIFNTLDECLTLVDDLNIKNYKYWNDTPLMHVKKDITSIFGRQNMIYGIVVNDKMQTFYLFTKMIKNEINN